jgi:hypothetical protein
MFANLLMNSIDFTVIQRQSATVRTPLEAHLAEFGSQKTGFFQQCVHEFSVWWLKTFSDQQFSYWCLMLLPALRNISIVGMISQIENSGSWGLVCCKNLCCARRTS